MDKLIRVLQIMGAVGSGGVENVIMNYYRHIDKKKIQFDFVMHQGSNQNYVDEVKCLGGNVYFVTPYSRNIFKFIIEVYRIIKNNHYEIVHCNMNALSAFPLFAVWLAGVKIRILHNHSTDCKEERLRTIIKHVLRPFAKLFANQYWACSKWAGIWMYGRQAVAEGKVTIINNAIDLEKFQFCSCKRNILRRQFCLDGCFVIGHVGRFMKQKNHEFLIDIFSDIIKKYNNARMILIGDGPLKTKIEEKVKCYGLQDKVIFTGDRRDVADLYNMMDVFVLPSLYEGLPLVGVESQANGLPIVCSDRVTEEISMSNGIKILPLKLSSMEWAEKICVYREKKRNEISSKLFESKFDIVNESCKLIEKYESFCLCKK